MACRELGSPGKFTTAYWFHGTRTSADNTFDSGLLPLNQTESLVMDMLVNLAPDVVVKERLQAWNFHAYYYTPENPVLWQSAQEDEL